MAEEVKRCSMNHAILSKNTFNIKEEYVENDKALVCDTANTSSFGSNGAVSDTETKYNEVFTQVDIKTELSSSERHAVVINDKIKVEDDVNTANDIKIESNSKQLLFCDQCNEDYQDYCTKCGMLVHILNKNTSSTIYNTAREEIPSDILECRESLGYYGIFALKVIPKNVKFGPFSGLGMSKLFWKIKGGRFLMDDDKSNYLNWMQYINPAKSISEHNLLVLQYEGCIYYRSSTEIREGEELLVYFGEEYEESVCNDFEMVFVPTIDSNAKDTFACTLCCLGFSDEACLIAHKTVCLNATNGNFPIKEFTQCPFCNIYLEKKEYLEYHMSHCSKTNIRQCSPHTQEDEKTDVMGRSSAFEFVNFHDRRKELNCSTSDYGTKDKSMLGTHTKGGKIKETRYACTECEYKANYKSILENHIRSKHLKEVNYECAECDFKTYYKSSLETHMNGMHLKQTKFECIRCEYKTSYKSALTNHIKKKHLRNTSYKCTECQFETNYKTSLTMHVKARHLQESDFKCSKCEYRTIYRSNLEKHIKRKHLKVAVYECNDCEYKTDRQTSLDFHMKARHLKEGRYKCADCKYKTNEKRYIRAHIKTKHLKEANFICADCDYKTNYKANLTDHVNRRHTREGALKNNNRRPNDENTNL